MPVSLRKLQNNTRWVAALVTGATLLCFSATASLAQDNDKGYVKEFSTDNGKDLVKEFSSDGVTQQPSGPQTETVTVGKEAEVGDDEQKRQADIAYKKKLLNAKLPETFEIAIKYHQLGDLEKAIPFYKKVLTEDPKFESGYNNLALCLMERKAAGDLGEATELLSQSQKLSSTDSEPSEKAVDAKTTELPSTKSANSGGAFFVQGQLSEQSGDLPKAIDYYLKALDQQRPLNLIIIRHLSELYVKMGNYNSARAVLKRGILSAPPEEHMKVLYQAITNLDNRAKPNKVE